MSAQTSTRGLVRRTAVVVAALVALLCVVFSNSFGRAEPTNNYRPALVPDPLALGCYPLPGGVTLDFPHQVRRDQDFPETDEGPRRALVVQYDEGSAAQIDATLRSAFAAAGYTPTSVGDSRAPAGGVATSLTNGTETVSWSVTPYDVPADSVVRGRISFDLPVTALASDDPDCTRVAVTKRFDLAEEALDR